ncbi:MAG: hypothetical protein AVDCRST_MAG18-5121, partial [uncultured Thermomicrobiales bacterium]
CPWRCGSIPTCVRRARARSRRRPGAPPARARDRATFSSAVSVGMRWNAWKTKPTRSRRNRSTARPRRRACR